MRYAMLAISLLSIVAACVETHDCTAAGCVSSVAIEVRRSSWQPGRYELRVEYAGVAIECPFTVPRWTPDDDAGSEASESDGGVASGEPQPTPHCEQTGPKVYTNLDVGQNVVLTVSDAPESLRIRVIRDGKTLRDDRVNPEYEKLQPNGAECGPTCQTAVVPIELP